MKKILTFILILFCMPAMAQHISITVGIPGAYIHYSNGGRYHRYYERRYDRDDYYYYNPRPIVVYPYRDRWYRPVRDHEYIIRDDRPIIYNRYPSGYNYTIGR